jgi:phosphatidylinositol alpha-1,6-mannosyltransferase
MDVPKTLVVTNDFPPRVGGVQRFVHSLVRRLPPERVTVLAPRSQGWERFDRGEPYEILRAPAPFMWPTGSLTGRVEALATERAVDVVLFGSPVPLAAVGPRLARRGLPYLTLAHGFEYWMSLLPGAHAALRYATSRASGVLVCSRSVARAVRTAVPEGVPVAVFPPGVDEHRFRPDLDVEDFRREMGVGGRPLVVCVSRLVARKGQDTLIAAMPEIRRRVADAALLVVGDGPDRDRLHRLAVSAPPGSVRFAGELGEGDLPLAYAAGDIFAMPCRNRLGGLEVEGWGMVFVEAAACGRPVVAGDSGGARETIVDGETGLLVDGRHVGAVAGAVAELLADPERAELMGKAGRERVLRELTWSIVADRLARWLRKAAGGSASGGPDEGTLVR